MKAAGNKYFLAIVLPPPLYDEAHALKIHFLDTYGSNAALRSPPHITLHMPFEWKSSKEDELVTALHALSHNLTPTDIKLKGFGCFKPRVIFINVELSPELVQAQRQIKKFCRVELGLDNADAYDKPFHPHVTLAFRDLNKSAFTEAWKEFGEKEFEGSFRADRICLLKHDGKQWNVFSEFPVGGIR